MALYVFKGIPDYVRIVARGPRTARSPARSNPFICDAQDAATQELPAEQGALVAAFEGGFIDYGSGAVIEPDVSHVRGARSTKVTAGSKGGVAKVWRRLDMDMSSCRRLRLWVHVDAGVKGIELDLSSQPWKRWLWYSPDDVVEGWNLVDVVRDDFASVHGDAWQAMTAIMVRVFSQPGQVGSATFDSLVMNEAHRPSVVVTFDDGHLSQFTTARPILASHGIVATTYVIRDRSAPGPGHLGAARRPLRRRLGGRQPHRPPRGLEGPRHARRGRSGASRLPRVARGTRLRALRLPRGLSLRQL